MMELRHSQPPMYTRLITMIPSQQEVPVVALYSIPISSSLCVGWACWHAFEVFTLSCTDSFAEVTVVAFTTNAFGDGPISMLVNINLKKTKNAQN